MSHKPADIVQWQQQVVPLANLKPYERNPRKHDAKAHARLKSKIERFGYHGRIIVTQQMKVIGGHLRLAVLNELGIDPVAVLVAPRPLTENEYRELLITDNLQDGAWDMDLLSTDFTLPELKEWGMPSDWLPANSPASGLTDPDATPTAPPHPIIILGDLWRLGDHRLLCGDSTKAEDVAKLMDGQKADMAYCDPPYGISVVRNHRLCGDKPFGKNGFDGIVKAGVYAPIVGDDTIQSALDSFALLKSLKIKTIIFWGGNFYAHALPPAKCWIVWDKETDGNFGDGEIAYCTANKSIRIFRHKWSGMLKASERGEKRIHPTQKPVALAEWCYKEFGKDGDTVIDLFCGSGCSIIAAEMTGRKCFAMEISPAYVDLAVIRWQNFTGKEAIHAETGDTFLSLSQARGAAAGGLGANVGAERNAPRKTRKAAAGD